MKKALLIILVTALVFTMMIPVSLCTPEESASPSPEESTSDTPEESEETSDTPEESADVMPDDATTQEAQSDFEILKLESSGIEVFKVQMRLRDLGYLNYRPTGQYFTLTQNAVIEFQQNNGLDTDGQIGQITYEKLFSSDVVRKPRSMSVPVYYGTTLASGEAPPAGNGEAADWSTVVDAAFPVGTTVTITDYNTAKTFSVKRTGGTGHADVETVDSAAYDTFRECFGVPSDGEPTWEKRPVLVTIDGTVYAASMFGHSDGEDTISDNGMAGHVCLYFSGSTSDVLGFVDKEHQKCVLTAAGLPLEY